MKALEYLDKSLMLDILRDRLATYKTPAGWKCPEEESVKDLIAYVVNEIPYIITEEAALKAIGKNK